MHLNDGVSFSTALNTGCFLISNKGRGRGNSMFKLKVRKVGAKKMFCQIIEWVEQSGI